MQDYLLPTCAYVGGPAELAYLAQSQVIYERLLGRMPVMISRAGFTLLEPHATKLLERYKLTLPQVFTDEDHLKERVAHSLVPESLAHSFDTRTGGRDEASGQVRAQSWSGSILRWRRRWIKAKRRSPISSIKPGARRPPRSCAATTVRLPTPILERIPLSAQAPAGKALFHSSVSGGARVTCGDAVQRGPARLSGPSYC